MEKINFIFDGQLATDHKMDFYESARFQYAASRLLVKLDTFRRLGTFPKKITNRQNPNILILPTISGSYGLEILIPIAHEALPVIYKTPMKALLSYVVDRVFHPVKEDNVKLALQNNSKLLDVFDHEISGKDEIINKSLDLLSEQISQNRKSVENERHLYERLLGDRDRRQILQKHQEVLRQIPDCEEASLINMAAPLLKEMNVPLRKSANKLNIIAADNDNFEFILSADKKMADAIDTEIVDRNASTIDINIVQFNKENGWGKFENPEWDGRPSFVIPGDELDLMKYTIMKAMRQNKVEADCLFVRSPAGTPIRIIVLDVREIDEI